MIEFPADPATEYAWRVVRGDVVAGPHVRDTCRRHIKDLVEGAERGLTWHVDEVEYVLDFFREVLTVEIEYEDEYGDLVSEAVPFQVHESQAFILGSLFGWKKNNRRRFRRAYIEIGKGNGKSPLAAGIGHYMMVATGKLRAEIYSAATDKDQAAILFRDAVAMYERCQDLYDRLIPSGFNPVWQLTYPATNSFFKPISSEKKGKSGIRPYCGLIDEVHEHPDNTVIEMLRAGTKGNQEALIFEITNSGASRDTVCWDEHEYSTKIASGELENDAWFSYVCALDGERVGEDGEKIPADDPFEDESCWIKANPLLGVSIFPEFIREQVSEARGMPSKEAMVRRLHFCQWTEGAETWITRAVWERCEREDLRIEDFEGAVAYGGLDLSYTRDLSAFSLVFPKWKKVRRKQKELPVIDCDCFVWFWKAKVDLQERINEDKVRYDLFAEAGELFLTEGRVIRLEPIGKFMSELAKRHDIRAIAYDNYRHRELEDDLTDLGIHDLPLVEHPQGFRRTQTSPLWMPNSVQEIENAIVESRIRFPINRLLRINVSQAVIRPDPAGTDNKIFDKRKSRARIDGIVAAAMAAGTAAVRYEPVFKGVTVEDIITPETA